MISKQLALEAALDYLTRNLRHRLEVRAGWPGEAERQECEEQPSPSPPVAVPSDSPDLVEIRASQEDSPARLSTEPPIVIKGFPRRVYSVLVPDEVGHVGSSEYVIVDADTGRVFTRMHYGE